MLTYSSSTRIRALVQNIRRIYTAGGAPITAAGDAPIAAAGDDPSLTSASPPTQGSVIYVLKKLEEKPHKALSFLKCLTSKHGFVPGPSTYNIMLTILANHRESIAEFWEFLKTSEDAGHSIDNATFSNLIENFKKQKLNNESAALVQFCNKSAKNNAMDQEISSVVKVIRDGSVGGWDEVEKRLCGLKMSVSEMVVARVVREVRGEPAKALGFFRWAGKSSGYKHGAIAYGAINRVLTQKESIGDFWSLVREMKEEGHDLDIDSYIKINRQFLKSRMVKDAVELYELMMDGPYKPAIQDCGILLRQISLSDAPDLDLVYRVVRKYEDAGFSLSKVVYDGIHRSLASAGKFDDAEEILQKMNLEGFEPDNITYSQLVFGLCKAKRLDDACKVLDKMKEVGCTPDVKTWTVLIQGHCNAGEVDKAVELSAKMIEQNCEADADVLDVLVKGLCSTKRPDGAYNLLTEMADKAQVRPWQATYKYLIQELLNVGLLEEALKTLGSMKSIKFPPFADPFPAYIAKHGTAEDAREFLKVLTVNNYPTSTAYLHVFKSFFKEGRYVDAQDLLFKCPYHIRKHAEIISLFGSIKSESVA